MILTTPPLICDAGSTSDFFQAARASGGAKEVDVTSVDTDGDLHRTATDLLAWVQAEAPAVGERDALRRELRFLVHRARTRARLHAKQYRRRASVRVALTREGDHLLTLLTEC